MLYFIFTYRRFIYLSIFVCLFISLYMYMFIFSFVLFVKLQNYYFIVDFKLAEIMLLHMAVLLTDILHFC